MNSATTVTSARNSTPERVVYRNLSLPVPVFDYIKDYQRAYMARLGEHLTITQTVSAIVLAHQQQSEEREAHKQSKQPALLRGL